MSQSLLKLAVRHVSERTSVIDVEGSLTAASEAALASAWNEASSDRTVVVVLNFSNLEYLNSSGIGVLVTLLVRANRRQQQLLACGLSEHYRHIFELTRLNDAIHIYDDVPAALQASAT
jgi:anti-anti-sigma factor